MNKENEEPHEDKESADKTTTPPADESAAAEQADESHKFIQMTKKATSSAERAIGSSYKKTASAVKSVHNDPMITVRLLDRFLEWARSTFPAGMFESVAGWFTRYGHTGLLLSAGVTLVFWLFAWTRTDLGFWASVLRGVGYSVLILVLQYTASKFLNAGETLVKSSPSRLGSAAFLDCLALLSEIAGIIVFFVCLVRWEWASFFFGLCALTLGDSIAFIALHPSIANITISEDTGAGEEAIGILSFLIKALVRIVPIIFGVGSFVGLLALVAATLTLLSFDAGKKALEMVILCACLPFASYVMFAFYHLTIDILRAILVLPRKLDQAIKK